MKRELEAILEKEILPATIPEFPTVRRMTLGMNSSLVVPSLFARAAAERQQREFTDGWDPLFIGYTAAVYFHTCDIKINSWTTQAKKMRGSMPPKFEVQEILRTLVRAGLENKLPVWDDCRMIVEEGHIALKDEMKFATRKYRAPYGLEQVEMRQKGEELDAAGPLYVALTEYKKSDPTTPSPLSVGPPGDKRSGRKQEKNLRETAPMVLARWKTAAYKSSSEPRKLLELERETEVSTSLATEEDFRPQRTNTKRGSTSGQTWEVDDGKEWISNEHQATGKQVTSDLLEKSKTRNTSRPWWVAPETLKELEDCLKKPDRGVSRKRRNWATQQKSEINKLELGSQLKRTRQNLLRDHFEEAMRTAAYKSSSEPSKLLEVEKEIEVSTNLATEEDFRPQRTKMRRGSTSGQTWEVDVGKEWVSNEHQATGKQVTSDPLEKNKTRNTSRPWGWPWKH